MPLSDKSLKVTDRRMFTPDGELREEYRDLEERSAADGASRPAETPPAARPAAPAPPADRPGAARPGAARPGADRPAAPRSDSPSPPLTGRVAEPPPEPGPGIGEGPGAPGFFDLVGLLAEPATIYLREARGADPQTATQSLELARLHIDLLAVLRAKTEGNLSAAEQSMLEDVIYQLRSGYVGLRG